LFALPVFFAENRFSEGLHEVFLGYKKIPFCLFFPDWICLFSLADFFFPDNGDSPIVTPFPGQT